MPKKGSKTNFELEIGRGSELENLYIRYKQNSEMYVAISKYLNSCFKFYGEHIKAIDNDVGKAREILFGGVSSLRGYEDNSFSTSSVLIPSFEFHYNGLNSINALFFFESGFSKDYSPKISYGLGAKKITNNALINIEFALPYKSPINEGKVHIKWLTRL
jgi:outer membrane protein assembly factor BamA